MDIEKRILRALKNNREGLTISEIIERDLQSLN
jgi:hypothetical protein